MPACSEKIDGLPMTSPQITDPGPPLGRPSTAPTGRKKKPVPSPSTSTDFGGNGGPTSNHDNPPWRGPWHDLITDSPCMAMDVHGNDRTNHRATLYKRGLRVGLKHVSGAWWWCGAFMSAPWVEMGQICREWALNIKRLLFCFLFLVFLVFYFVLFFFCEGFKLVYGTRLVYEENYKGKWQFAIYVFLFNTVNF